MADPELGEIYQQLRALESELDSSEQASRYAERLNAFRERDGFRLQAESEKIMAGLGFTLQEEKPADGPAVQWSTRSVGAREAFALIDRPASHR